MYICNDVQFMAVVPSPQFIHERVNYLFMYYINEYKIQEEEGNIT